MSNLHCACGAPIEDMMGERPADIGPEHWTPIWVHRKDSTTPCINPRPIENLLPERQDRARLSDEMRKLHGDVNRAADAMRVMRDAVREFGAQLDGMSAMLDAVHRTRRATINQVWDKLIESGEVGAAKLVREMLKAHDRGDWQ